MDNFKFTFISKRGIIWHVECSKCQVSDIYYAYMWHRKPHERITGGWRLARTDQYAPVSKEAIKYAQEKFGIVLEKYPVFN